MGSIQGVRGHSRQGQRSQRHIDCGYQPGHGDWANDIIRQRDSGNFKVIASKKLIITALLTCYVQLVIFDQVNKSSEILKKLKTPSKKKVDCKTFLALVVLARFQNGVTVLGSLRSENRASAMSEAVWPGPAGTRVVNVVLS